MNLIPHLGHDHDNEDPISALMGRGRDLGGLNEDEGMGQDLREPVETAASQEPLPIVPDGLVAGMGQAVADIGSLVAHISMVEEMVESAHDVSIPPVDESFVERAAEMGEPGDETLDYAPGLEPEEGMGHHRRVGIKEKARLAESWKALGDLVKGAASPLVAQGAIRQEEAAAWELRVTTARETFDKLAAETREFMEVAAKTEGPQNFEKLNPLAVIQSLETSGFRMRKQFSPFSGDSSLQQRFHLVGLINPAAEGDLPGFMVRLRNGKVMIAAAEEVLENVQ